MSSLHYHEPTGDLHFRNPEGFDFISPATQDVLMKRRNPGWEAVHASRMTSEQMWERPDLFRTLDYEHSRRTYFGKPSVEFLSASATPSGRIDLRTARRNSSISLSDKDLYHFNVQKMFALFCQFDTMVQSQVSAFMGVGHEETQRCLNVLHAAEILEKPYPDWYFDDKVGTLWRINMYSPKIADYQNGMDSLHNLLAFGNHKLGEAPPGSGSRSAIRHNLYTAEIMLRVAEGADNVTAIWGDLFASEQLFHDRDPDAAHRDSHGDAVAITKDGAIVIFETTGSVSSSRGFTRRIIDKAASWVGVIANSDLDISVIFINTSWEEDRKMVMNAVDIGVGKESQAYAVHEHSRRRAMKKIGVVNAAWWFPDDGVMSRAATRLGAYSPHLQKFIPFDTPDLEASTPELRRNVVLNSVSSLHTPPWIRNKVKDRDFTQ